MPTAEVCRRHGLSPASFYKFKAKYGGMSVSDTHRLKSLEDENAKLKRLLADTMLDSVVLKDLLGKNGQHRMCDGLQHARQCEIIISRNVVRAGLSVLIPRPSGVIISRIIQKFAKRCRRLPASDVGLAIGGSACCWNAKE